MRKKRLNGRYLSAGYCSYCDECSCKYDENADIPTNADVALNQLADW